MSTITTVVPPFTKVPNINDSVNFESDTNTFLNEINARYTAGNSQTSEINVVADEVNSNAIQTLNNKTIVDTKSADVSAKYTEIMGYVIPTEATYSPATIDDKDAQISQNIPLIDFSRVESYVKADSTRWIKNNGKGVDGEMLSGQMLNFNGTTQSVTVSKTTTSNIYTLFFSLKTSATSGKIIDGANVSILSNKLNYGGFSSVSSINDNLYKRIAITVNGTSMKFYINGVLDSTNTITASTFNLSKINDGLLSGNIGNIILLDGKEASLADIQLDYAQPELILGVATNTIQSPFSFDTNSILACFPMQEGIMGSGSAWDIKSGTSYSIANYATTMWTNANIIPYGIQQNLLVKDDVNNFVTGISKYTIDSVTDLGNPTLSPYYEESESELTLSSITSTGFTAVSSGTTDTNCLISSKWNSDVTIESNTLYRVSYDYVVNSGTAFLKTVYLPNAITSTINKLLSGSGKISTLIHSTTSKLLDSSESFIAFDNTQSGGTYSISISNIKIEKVEYSELPQMQVGSNTGYIETGIKWLDPTNGITERNFTFVMNRPDSSLMSDTNQFMDLQYPFRFYLNSGDNRLIALIGSTNYFIDLNADEYTMFSMNFKYEANYLIVEIYKNNNLIIMHKNTNTTWQNIRFGGDNNMTSILAQMGMTYPILQDKYLSKFEINELYNNIKTNAPTLALP